MKGQGFISLTFFIWAHPLNPDCHREGSGHSLPLGGIAAVSCAGHFLILKFMFNIDLDFALTSK